MVVDGGLAVLGGVGAISMVAGQEDSEYEGVALLVGVAAAVYGLSAVIGGTWISRCRGSHAFPPASR